MNFFCISLSRLAGEAPVRRGGAGRGEAAGEGLQERPHLLRRVQVRQARAQNGPPGLLRR